MKKGEKIQPHLHLKQERNLQDTQEILFVQSGQLIVNFYEDPQKNLICKSIKMQKGDLIYLKQGIHGFSIGQDCKFIEIKQGPFKDGEDKVKLFG